MSDPSTGSGQSNLHPAIEKSHEVFDTVWKTLPPEQKEAIKGLVQAIGQLETQVLPPIDSQGPPRFPDSRYVAFTSQHGSLVLPTGDGAGVLWEITTRADTVQELFGQLKAAQDVALHIGFLPADRYIDQRRQERTDSQPGYQTLSVATPGSSQRVAMSQPANQNGHPSTPALSIVAAPMSDKKPDLIWKIRTSKSRFPVPIYEAIEEVKPAMATEGIDLSTFVTPEGKLREYQLSGWVALYEQNENGYPSKVVKLAKV